MQLQRGGGGRGGGVVGGEGDERGSRGAACTPHSAEVSAEVGADASAAPEIIPAGNVRSVAIRGNPWQSVAISGNQKQSVAISGNQCRRSSPPVWCDTSSFS